MPNVSIIMGVYNSNNEEMLKSSIESILNQSYKDFEFIICDDGSNDGTYELLEKLTKNDKRVILLKNDKNMGLAATLNKCIEISTGEFIARMDADDISILNRIERQVNFLKMNTQYDMVGSNALLFDENGEWGNRRTIEIPDKKSFLFCNPFIHPSIIIRKSTLIKLCGYRSSKETIRCEDYDLFMRLYAMNGKGYNIQDPLLKFRENKAAYKRRKYKYRLDEAIVRYKGFKRLGLMPIGLVYVLKPLIVGLIPQKLLAIIRNERV